jgi:4-hydroxyphenylpyruvate dioxygenase
MPQVEPLGILGIEGVHYYVRDLERSRRFYVDRLDFQRDRREQSGADGRRAAALGGFSSRRLHRDLLDARRRRRSRGALLKRHPDGVGTLAFRVENAARTFELLERRGGTPIGDLERFEDATGTLKTFSITTPFGDTTFRFIERRGYGDLLPGYVMHDPPRGGQNATGILRVDHITTNFSDDDAGVALA